MALRVAALLPPDDSDRAGTLGDETDCDDYAQYLQRVISIAATKPNTLCPVCIRFECLMTRSPSFTRGDFVSVWNQIDNKDQRFYDALWPPDETSNV
jgi:hypothetical protein